MIKGKVICVNDNEILVSNGYVLSDGHNHYRLIDKKYGFLSRFKLTRRLLRAEITSFYTLSDGTQLALAKKGIFRRWKDEKDFIKICPIPRGSKPLNLCIPPSGNIYFGEYFQNVDNLPIHIYKLNVEDGSLEKVYTFSQGEINHIHGLFFDKYTNRIWAVTGDAEHECIIGYTEDELKELGDISDEEIKEINKQISENIDIVEEGEEQEEVLTCPECGHPIDESMTECPNCHVGLSFEVEE